MTVKLSYGFVQSQFSAEGYTLLSTEYKNCMVKLEYRCPEGHENSIRYSSFQSGCRCPSCNNESKRNTLEFVKSEFSAEGYTLLSTEYEGALKKLEYRCPEGHENSIRYNDFKSGCRCPSCFGNEARRHTLEFVKSEFRKSGYEPLFTEYEHNQQKLEYRCTKGHEHSITYNDFSKGRRCGVCFPGGFNSSLPGILYYLEFIHQDQNYFKIGITNHSVKYRFSGDLIKPEILWYKPYTIGQDAYNEEQDILKFYRPVYGYKGIPFLKSGNTELFTQDIRFVPENPYRELNLKRHRST